MLFNSLQFLIFFPIVTIAYFILPHKYRWLLLLIASSYFYMSFVPKYILILAFTIITDYFAGQMIERAEEKNKKLFLIISIIANIGVLFLFKYFNFFNENIAELASFLNWNYSFKTLSLLLPIGLSFHTFQSLSYIIEVYNGRQKAEKNLGIFALYVMFYPQLVAGPIERPQHLLHQFYEKHVWDWPRVSSGLKLMLWGLFKKIVIADTLAVYVNAIYNSPTSSSSPTLILATIFFTFQIFCDFSGYSDIAVGSAKVMGFELMNNFNRPFSSKSIADFWRRWHISLSSWFGDYVFKPLYLKIGRIKVLKDVDTKFRHNFSFIISTLVGITLLGLWHGAKWTFVFFGLYHSLMIIFYYSIRKFWDKMFNPVKIILNFLIISAGWIFFRPNNLNESLIIINKIFLSWNTSLSKIFTSLKEFANIVLPNSQFLWAIFGITIIILTETVNWQEIFEKMFSKLNFWPNGYSKHFINWFLVSTAILLILLSAKSGGQPFIYFQF